MDRNSSSANQFNANQGKPTDFWGNPINLPHIPGTSATSYELDIADARLTPEERERKIELRRRALKGTNLEG